MKKGLQSGDKQFSLMLLSPAVIITVIFILVPVVDSIYRSFFDYKVKNIISGKPGTWNNFAKLSHEHLHNNHLQKITFLNSSFL